MLNDFVCNLAPIKDATILGLRLGKVLSSISIIYRYKNRDIELK